MDDSNFYRSTVRLDKETYLQLTKIANNQNDSLTNVIREVIKKGLAIDLAENSSEIIAEVVEKQVEKAMKNQLNRFATLQSKVGHMSATAAFLNVQALMDLVPNERKKDVREMYEKARKRSAKYMKEKLENLDDDLLD